ncbi:MAG TPA: hypothetical protein VF718_06015 [Allosphingosinicella sp.]
MRALTAAGLVALMAVPDAASAGAKPEPTASAPDEGWETFLEIKKLSPDFAAHPEKATMSGRSAGWTLWPEPPELPAELRRRVFLNESYLLLDVDGMGKPARCRPLRRSAMPRLDAASCELLKKLGYFSTDFLPAGRPRPPDTWVVGVKWKRMDPATARRDAVRPRPLIVPAPSPPPPKQR